MTNGQAGYPLDTTKFVEQTDLTANGIVEPVPVWREGEDGKRQRTDLQSTDEAGVPEWFVHVSYLGEAWGRPVEKSATVRVPSRTMPRVQRHHRVLFEDLHLSVRVNKRTGGLIEEFTATGIRQAGGEK